MAPSFLSSKPNLSKPGPVKKLFTRDWDNFKSFRQPNIIVSSPDCGASGEVGNLNGTTKNDAPVSLFPTLSWEFEADEKDDSLARKLERVKEYLIIVQDLDGGLLGSGPETLGMFYLIPRDKTNVTPFDIVREGKRGFEMLRGGEHPRGLVGGFKYGDLNGKVWIAPKKMHRIHFQVIATARTMDNGSLSDFPSTNSFQGECEGAVVGWGEWVGIYEK